MTPKEIATVMVTCNRPEVVEMVVEAVVRQHNAKPTEATRDFLLAIIELRPDIVREE